LGLGRQAERTFDERYIGCQTVWGRHDIAAGQRRKGADVVLVPRRLRKIRQPAIRCAQESRCGSPTLEQIWPLLFKDSVPVRIAIVAHIHGNVTAIEAVIADRRKVGIDMVLQVATP
jgi:hypothetical protein